MKLNILKKSVNILSVLLICGFIQINAQTITLNAVLSGKVTSSDVNTSGAVTNLCSTCDLGYVKFDLSSIPAGESIISAKLKLVAINPSASSGVLTNKITTTSLDAATATTGFYSGINSGNTAWTGTWSLIGFPLPATFNMTLNSAGITDLNNRLTEGQITFGIVRGSTNVYSFGGYDDLTPAYIPQLEITYGNGTVGVIETEIEGVSIYPNPTTGIFNVSIVSPNSNHLSLSVCDVQGRVVYSFSDKNSHGNYAEQIDLSGLSKGIYFLKLTNGTQLKVQKIILE